MKTSSLLLSLIAFFGCCICTQADDKKPAAKITDPAALDGIWIPADNKVPVRLFFQGNNNCMVTITGPKGTGGQTFAYTADPAKNLVKFATGGGYASANATVVLLPDGTLKVKGTFTSNENRATVDSVFQRQK